MAYQRWQNSLAAGDLCGKLSGWGASQGCSGGLGMCAIFPELWLVFQRGAEQGVWWSSRAVLTMMWWQNGADPGVQHVGMVWQGGVIYQFFGIANLQFSHSISTAFSTEYPKEIITRFIMWKWHSCNMS